MKPSYKYRTGVNISRGLYIFYPIFEIHFFCFQGVSFRIFCPYVYLRAVYNKERVMIARIRYTTIQKML